MSAEGVQPGGLYGLPLSCAAARSVWGECVRVDQTLVTCRGGSVDVAEVVDGALVVRGVFVRLAVVDVFVGDRGQSPCLGGGEQSVLSPHALAEQHEGGELVGEVL